MSAAVSLPNPSVQPLYIDGRWRMGCNGEVADDVNPATGEVFARVAQAGLRDVEDAIAAAHAARVAWGGLLVREREAVLLRTAEVIERQAVQIRDLIIEETGSVLMKAPWEVSYAVECLRSAAACTRQPHGATFPPSAEGQRGMTIRQPLGVIAGIAPFNSPFLLAIKKVAFALAAGNTFVLKPSDLAPLTGLKLAEMFHEAGLPPGVLNVIPGPAAVLGDRLISDPRVKMITFTGSSKIGRHLAAEAGRHMKRITLEMGGKNPLVVLADANVAYAVDAAAFGIFFHQGQVCMASSRVIVEAPLYDEFLERFVAKARTIRVGDPRDPATVIGPLIRPSQCTFIAGQIADAVAHGARVCCGGTHRGAYFEATVLADVTRDMAIYGEESFGPITSLLRAEDYEHALFLANDTSAGLSSAVITNDLQRAMDFALRAEAGMVHINDATISDEPHIDFGGFKESGFGREGGMASMEEMSQVKWITVQMGQRKFPF